MITLDERKSDAAIAIVDKNENLIWGTSNQLFPTPPKSSFPYLFKGPFLRPLPFSPTPSSGRTVRRLPVLIGASSQEDPGRHRAFCP